MNIRLVFTNGLVVAFLAACSTTQSDHRQTMEPVTPLAAVEENAEETERETTGESWTTLPAIQLTPQGALLRADLKRLIDLGPQAFISNIQVKPAFRKHRFWGWNVVAYNGPGQLLPGDVVMRVNGQPIERPEQFMEVWEAVPRQREFTVEMERNGNPIYVRLPIVD